MKSRNNIADSSNALCSQLWKFLGNAHVKISASDNMALRHPLVFFSNSPISYPFDEILN